MVENFSSLVLFSMIICDTIPPYDTTQVRLDLDFGIKNATVQVHGNNYNFQSDCWIRVIFYVDSPNMFYYLGLKIRSIEVREGTAILVNEGCTNFVIYFHLTCGLPIWLGFFSYKDVAAGFRNFLVPQGSLMSCNIISKCGKDSYCFRILFLYGFIIHPSYTRKEELVVFNDRLVIFVILFNIWA